MKETNNKNDGIHEADAARTQALSVLSILFFKQTHSDGGCFHRPQAG